MAERPIRVQLSRRKGWRMPPNTVKVDRSTPWGNPFVTSKHGTREECVRLYTLLMAGNVCLTTGNSDEQMIALRHVRKHRADLRGKNFACWCPLDQPCHAAVLLEIANG